MEKIRAAARKIFTTLRPLEMLGLFFATLMVALYLYFDLSLYPRAFFFFCKLVGAIFVIFLGLRLIFNKNFKEALSFRVILAFIRDWIPLFIFIAVYDNLHDITRLINPYDFDALFIAIDKFLFFGYDPTLLFEKLICPAATEWLSLAYGLYFFFFPVTLGVLYFLNKKREFFITGFSVMLAVYGGFILYVLFPCVGPILAQHDLYTVDIDGGLTFNLYQQAMHLYGSYRNYFHCFPSLHFAVTAIFWFYSWKYVRWLFYLYAPLVISLWISTMYLRWHYVTDLIAGAFLAVAAIYFGQMLYEKWEKWREKVGKNKS
ncbi:phosphatase PAP2 family protein [Patescibacteria group bacterium]